MIGTKGFLFIPQKENMCNDILLDIFGSSQQIPFLSLSTLLLLVMMTGIDIKELPRLLASVIREKEENECLPSQR